MNQQDFEKYLTDAGISIGTTPGSITDPRIVPIDPTSFLDVVGFIQEKKIFKRQTTGGAIYYAFGFWKTWQTSISSAGATPGSENMKLNDIETWFDQHTGTRAFVKSAAIFVVGYLVANQAALLATLPADKLGMAAAIFGALGWALNWMKSHTKWPVVGARAP